jgi:hypothetical protein
MDGRVNQQINRTKETIGHHLCWPKMRTFITNSVSGCAICQRNKKQRKKYYGLLPEKISESTPWDKLSVDLIGPYKIRRTDKTTLVCRCVTMIDPATGWFEIHQYNDDKRSITVANIVEQEWFSRYLIASQQIDRFPAPVIKGSPDTIEKTMEFLRTEGYREAKRR